MPSLYAHAGGLEARPDRFTRELGFTHLTAVHRGLNITEEQRQRFVAL
jgi:hemoglobin